jgi:hypothetical protein
MKTCGAGFMAGAGDNTAVPGLGLTPSAFVGRHPRVESDHCVAGVGLALKVAYTSACIFAFGRSTANPVPEGACVYLAAAAYSDLPRVETDTKPLLNNGSGFLWAARCRRLKALILRVVLPQ